MSKARFIENYRPPWLFGMELDFYFPDLKYAIEFNGDQHIANSKYGSPNMQKWRDYRKQALCREKGIFLRVLEAADLGHTMLAGKVAKVKDKGFIKANLNQLRVLNRESKDYRKSLIERFGSATARRKKSKVRGLALAGMNKLFG